MELLENRFRGKNTGAPYLTSSKWQRVAEIADEEITTVDSGAHIFAFLTGVALPRSIVVSIGRRDVDIHEATLTRCYVTAFRSRDRPLTERALRAL